MHPGAALVAADAVARLYGIVVAAAVAVPGALTLWLYWWYENAVAVFVIQARSVDPEIAVVVVVAPFDGASCVVLDGRSGRSIFRSDCI